MASVSLADYPKMLDTKIEDLVSENITTKEVILGAIVLYALSQQDQFDKTRVKSKINLKEDRVLVPVPFPIGSKDNKKAIQEWGKKAGRKEISHQILFIISRFFELEMELPLEFLEKAASLR